MGLATLVTTLLIACGGGATATPPFIDLDAVPDVDLSKHSVPLEDVWFDTFTGSVLRLTSGEGNPRMKLMDPGYADAEDRRRLRDAIKPIYDPVYSDADALPWLQDFHLVVGYESASGAFAYPVLVLNFHELVNDVIDGIPVLITYCPLCASGVVFSRDVDGETLLFGNTSALYQSDLVMYDHKTGSYWFQVAGEAIIGEMTGKRLDLLPSMTVPWGRWKEIHPDTKLLVQISRNDPPFDDSYASDPFSNLLDGVDKGYFGFPVSADKLDDRLPYGEMVISVEVNSAVKVYPLQLIGDGTVMDEIGGHRVVVFSLDRGRSGAAYLATVDGQPLTFQFAGDVYTDDETSSRWSFNGLALEGPLKGTKLKRLPTRRAFWFSIASALPGVDLYLPKDAEP